MSSFTSEFHRRVRVTFGTYGISALASIFLGGVTPASAVFDPKVCDTMTSAQAGESMISTRVFVDQCWVCTSMATYLGQLKSRGMQRQGCHETKEDCLISPIFSATCERPFVRRPVVTAKCGDRVTGSEAAPGACSVDDGNEICRGQKPGQFNLPRSVCEFDTGLGYRVCKCEREPPPALRALDPVGGAKVDGNWPTRCLRPKDCDLCVKIDLLFIEYPDRFGQNRFDPIYMTYGFLSTNFSPIPRHYEAIKRLWTRPDPVTYKCPAGFMALYQARGVQSGDPTAAVNQAHLVDRCDIR